MRTRSAVLHNPYFFIFGSKIKDARYPKISAAEIPTALALNPPMNIPMNPFSSTASFTPCQSVFPKPSSGTEAPDFANSLNGS